VTKPSEEQRDRANDVAREIAEKINADARMRLVCLKPEYDTIDMGARLIATAIASERERALREAADFCERIERGLLQGRELARWLREEAKR
jgi:hypothetical protein